MRFFAFLLCTIVLAAPDVSQAQATGPSDAVEMTANGSINWTAGEVYAKGIGAPPARTANPAQARAMAERAAFVVAIRNLLETVKGVRVDSESVVENFMVKSDVIRTRVDGIVRGARILKTEYISDGSVEVLVGMNLKGAFMSAVVPDNFGRTSLSPVPPSTTLKPADTKPGQPSPPAVKPLPPSAATEKKSEPAKPLPVTPAPAGPSASEPDDKIDSIKQPPVQPDKKSEPVKTEQPQQFNSSSTVAFKGGVATGLIIDARGLGLRPALLPKIVDQQGQEVYVGQVVPRTNAVEQGVAGYAKDVNAAANNFRVTDNPVVIKALNASGPVKTDVMIGQVDAQALRQLSSKGDFLQYCRVIIVY